MKNKKSAGLLGVLVVIACAVFFFYALPKVQAGKDLDKVMYDIDSMRGRWGEQSIDRYKEEDIKKMDDLYVHLNQIQPSSENMLELVKLACYRKDFDLAEKRVGDMKSQFPEASETDDAPRFITMYKDFWSEAKVEERKKAAEARQQRQGQGGQGRQGGANGGGGQNGGQRNGGPSGGANGSTTGGAPSGGTAGQGGADAPSGRRRPGGTTGGDATPPASGDKTDSAPKGGAAGGA